MQKKSEIYSLPDFFLKVLWKLKIIALWQDTSKDFAVHHDKVWKITDTLTPLNLPSSRARVEKIIEYIGNVDGQKMLELGVGGGGHIALQVAKEGADISIMDISMKELCISTNMASGICANAEDLPFHKDVFDVCYTTEMIEHVVLPKKVLMEINMVLKPNGTVIITFPCAYGVGIITDLIFPFAHGIRNKLMRKEPPLVPNGHINIFSIKSFKKLAKDTGFTVCELYSVKTSVDEMTLLSQHTMIDTLINTFQITWAYLISNKSCWILKIQKVNPLDYV